MTTRILVIDPSHVSEDQIREIRDVLTRNGVMAYPTDTVYGLGSDARSAVAVRKIYALKQRSAAKPSPVLVSGVNMAERLAVDAPGAFRLLAARFWPGPLTLILRVREEFPREILGPGPSLAMRLPQVAWIRELAASLGAPLVATSANISGEKELTDPGEVVSVFDGLLDLIVEGGKSPALRPSTVVDLTSSEPKIIREGVISGAAVMEAVKK